MRRTLVLILSRESRMVSGFFSRKAIFGYKAIVLSSMAIAMVGSLVWAHHMFTSGMANFLRVPFTYSTLLVAIPTGIKFFSSSTCCATAISYQL